jgi:hypothetical protein
MQHIPSSIKDALLHEAADAPLPFAEAQKILREQQSQVLSKYRTR